MAAKKRTHPCSPAIWRKFGETEKRWWMMFYRDFLGELKLGTKSYLPHILSEERRKTIAHNHATLAVWAMAGVMDRVFKALKGPK